jgi:WD40 repeat protein
MARQAQFLGSADEFIVSVGQDRAPRLWDARDGRELRRFAAAHTSDVLSLACSPDGRTFYTGGQDSTVCVWDKDREQPVKRVPRLSEGSTTTVVALTRDGGTLAVSGWHPGRDRAGGGSACIRLFETVTMTEVGRIPWTVAPSAFEPLKFSRDGTALLALCQSGDLEARASSWAVCDVRQRKVTEEIPHPKPVGGRTRLVGPATFLPDENLVLLPGDWMTVWDRRERRGTAVRTTGYMLAVSRDGRLVAASGNGHRVSFLDAGTRAVVGTAGWPALLPDTDTSGVAFSRNGRRLAVAGYDSVVRVWEVAE